MAVVGVGHRVRVGGGEQLPGVRLRPLEGVAVGREDRDQGD